MKTASIEAKPPVQTCVGVYRWTICALLGLGESGDFPTYQDRSRMVSPAAEGTRYRALQMDLSQRLRVAAGCSFPNDDGLLKDQLSRRRYLGPKVLAEHPFNDVCGYVQSPRLCQDLFEPSCFLAIVRFCCYFLDQFC
jgi:hypothetical protein